VGQTAAFSHDGLDVRIAIAGAAREAVGRLYGDNLWSPGASHNSFK
jgi:hypothetical protein